MPQLSSLRTEFLVHIGVLAAAALFLGVASIIVLYGVLDPAYAPIYISILVAVDVLVVVAYVAYLVNKAMLRPLQDAMAAAEAIAAGDLARRLSPGNTTELANLAISVNKMTDRLLEDRVHIVRAEKMASVGRLAAGIAHEIGNPLGAINGYTHVLRSAASPSDRSDAIAGLERESARIDRIVRGLLDYAKPTPRASGAVDFNDVGRNVVDLLESQGVLKHVALRFSPDGTATHVAADRHDLEQILVNLVLNAVDVMQGKGSLEVIIRTVARQELKAARRRGSDESTRPGNPPSVRVARWLDENECEGVVMVAVIDSGTGVAPEDVERIFEPFYTTKGPGEGTGLGLAIVARAVENAGGAIWVTPAREGGAAFRMIFPMVVSAKRA